MLELFVRAVVAGLLVLVAGWTGRPDFGMAVGIAVGILSYAFIGWHMTRRVPLNAGHAGILATFDSAAIAAMLGATGRLESFGFLVLAPIAYAAATYGSLPTALAPLATASLFGAQAIFGRTEPTPAFYVQGAGVLMVGLLLNHRRIVVTVTRDLVGSIEPLSGREPDGFLELRENFRKLKELYRELEAKSARDHRVARLLETRLPNGERFASRLAEVIRELCGAEGVSLYEVAVFDRRMVVRATSGTSMSMDDRSLAFDVGDSPGRMRHRLERALMALDTPDRGLLSNIILIHQGKVVGMLCLRASTTPLLDAARDAAEDLAPLVAQLIAEERRRTAESRRLHQVELLYETAVVTQGAETPNALVGRLLVELQELVDADHLGIYWLDDLDLLPAALAGERIDLFETLSFGFGPGLEGWLRSGSPEILAHDAREDARALPGEMSKRRIGSFALLPLDYGQGVVGLLVAVCRRVGGLDRREMEILQLMTAELARGLGELRGAFDDGDGLVTAQEFARKLHEPGCLVILEPLKKESLLEMAGKPALDHALRKFAQRVRAKLPPGGAVCRRAQGDLVAYLRTTTASEAQRWANEIAAMAALIGVSAGSERYPFAIRAKVSVLEKDAPVA